MNYRSTIMMLVLGVTACGRATEVEPSGSLRMGIIGADEEGTVYRLRGAVFAIEGPTSTAVDAEDYELVAIHVDVEAGDYEITLLEGWEIETWDPRAGTTGIVDAVLLSDNPLDTVVVADELSVATFAFFIDGVGPIQMGEGAILINIGPSTDCGTIADSSTCDATDSCEWDAATLACVSSGCPLPVPEVCGDGLDNDCDGTVDNGCACEHDVCSEGERLRDGCDDCVSAICAVDGFCCTGNWDNLCVGEVASVCGQVC